ncbi:MAG: hypothetical protein F6J93_20745 [Oscillatoria sp. SIO1A7]|nr:hypothetical protein [Oscillatoria sp. SIO1A7]
MTKGDGSRVLTRLAFSLQLGIVGNFPTATPYAPHPRWGLYRKSCQPRQEPIRGFGV